MLVQSTTAIRIEINENSLSQLHSAGWKIKTLTEDAKAKTQDTSNMNFMR